jgi:hypothetical protein
LTDVSSTFPMGGGGGGRGGRGRVLVCQYTHLNLRGLQVLHEIIVQYSSSDEVLALLGLLILREGPCCEVLHSKRGQLLLYHRWGSCRDIFVQRTICV